MYCCGVGHVLLIMLEPLPERGLHTTSCYRVDVTCPTRSCSKDCVGPLLTFMAAFYYDYYRIITARQPTNQPICYELLTHIMSYNLL